jgi:hypothetical protein
VDPLEPFLDRLAQAAAQLTPGSEPGRVDPQALGRLNDLAAEMKTAVKQGAQELKGRCEAAAAEFKAKGEAARRELEKGEEAPAEPWEDHQGLTAEVAQSLVARLLQLARAGGHTQGHP